MGVDVFRFLLVFVGDTIPLPGLELICSANLTNNARIH